MPGKLEGKVAIVTGSSSGIGEATAIALAAEGAKVAIAARRAERLNALAERIAASGGTALPIVTDVTDDAQVLERVGLPVAATPGSAVNLKITTAADVLLAEGMLAAAEKTPTPA